MSRTLLPFALSLAFALAPAAHSLPTDDEVTAHSRALGVAGAFQNAGFKLRDGVWSGRLEAGKTCLVQVNLYAGNQYWFSVGAVGSKGVTVTIFDEAGAALEAEPYADEGTSAAGFSPTVSGPYYVKIGLSTGAAGTACLVYSYK